MIVVGQDFISGGPLLQTQLMRKEQRKNECMTKERKGGSEGKMKGEWGKKLRMKEA